MPQARVRGKSGARAGSVSAFARRAFLECFRDRSRRRTSRDAPVDTRALNEKSERSLRGRSCCRAHAALSSRGLDRAARMVALVKALPPCGSETASGSRELPRVLAHLPGRAESCLVILLRYAREGGLRENRNVRMRGERSATQRGACSGPATVADCHPTNGLPVKGGLRLMHGMALFAPGILRLGHCP